MTLRRRAARSYEHNIYDPSRQCRDLRSTVHARGYHFLRETRLHAGLWRIAGALQYPPGWERLRKSAPLAWLSPFLVGPHNLSRGRCRRVLSNRARRRLHSYPTAKWCLGRAVLPSDRSQWARVEFRPTADVDG